MINEKIKIIVVHEIGYCRDCPFSANIYGTGMFCNMLADIVRNENRGRPDNCPLVDGDEYK